MCCLRIAQVKLPPNHFDWRNQRPWSERKKTKSEQKSVLERKEKTTEAKEVERKRFIQTVNIDANECSLVVKVFEVDNKEQRENKYRKKYC